MASLLADGRLSDTPHGEIVYIEEPAADLETDAANKLTPAHNPITDVRPDEGYLMKGWRRVLRAVDDSQKWWYTESDVDDEKTQYQENPPGPERFSQPDIYTDTKTFPNKETTVQIVEFRKAVKVPSKWYPPMSKADDVHRVLKSPPANEDAWRWVHCTGLHGPTLKAVAKATGWSLRKFGGIFTWTRASMEWADNMLLVHFENQGTRIFIWHGGGTYPVLITCNTMDPKDSSITRIFDFVDRGCSRPEIILREDPSLLFYGVVRAVIQDLRYSVHHIGHKMGEAFRKSTSKPSPSNLTYFYHLQDRLFILSLDATSLKNATMNLVKAADRMHDEDEELEAAGKPPNPRRLISERTRFMLNDQMGLITLLSEELPDISRRARGIVDLAFNTLAFNTNNLVLILAVITIASLPLTITTDLLGMNYFSLYQVRPEVIGVTLAVIGGLVIIGVIWFSTWFIRMTRGGGEDEGARLPAPAKPNQTIGLFSQEKQTAKQREDWARAQDLERDNQAIVQQKQAHDPIMRKYPEHQVPPPALPPPQRRITLGAISLRRPARNATSYFPRNEAAAGEEWPSLDRFALRTRRPTSLTTATEVDIPDSPPRERDQNASASPLPGHPLPVSKETPSQVSQ